MPVIEGKYQCKLCDDIFEAKSDGFYKCNCGKSEVEPSLFGYSYKNGNRVNTIDQNSYYLKEEFVKFPDDVQKIYEEIKQIKEVNGYKYHLFEMTDTGKDGEKFLSNISFSYSEFANFSSEKNEISFGLSLRKEDYIGDERAKLRLQRLLDIIKQIEAEELNISKRSEMVKMADEQHFDYREEPTGETNFTFYL